MARVIWNQRGNRSKYVSDSFGIERWRLGEALHEIKHANNLGATDGVIIYDDGEVTDERGEHLGNIFDEI
jgi:hypothetical protein